MQIKYIIISIYLLTLSSLSAVAQGNGLWGDQGDGTFRNPVIAADYSDPDPLRVGDDYYLAASTFESAPGVTILHSRDLVNWTPISAAFTQLGQVSEAYTYRQMGRYNGGVYAPTLTYHDGTYYLYANLYTDGFYMAKATDPRGPWQEQFLKDKHGRELRVQRWTDPCPFWDDDGKAYLVASHPGREYWYSYIFQMTPDGTQLLDADSAHMSRWPVLYEYPNGGTVISPNHSSEGNRLFKRDGYYYFQHIEFTDRGQGEGTYIARSRHIYGTHADGTPGTPGNMGQWEQQAIERVSSRDNLRLPGQGGYVDTPDGRWWWIGQFTRDFGCGRPPILLPVEWRDGWPVIGKADANGQGHTVWQLEKPLQGQKPTLPLGSDSFSQPTLHLRWAWNHTPDSSRFSLIERPGYMRLKAAPTIDGKGFFGARNTLCQRYMYSQATDNSARIDITHMADGQVAGLAHFNGGKQVVSIAVERRDGQLYVCVKENELLVAEESIPSKTKTITLSAHADADDMATFSYALKKNKPRALGNAFKLKAGNFRGDMVGLFTYNDQGQGGYADIDWFEYTVKNRP